MISLIMILIGLNGQVTTLQQDGFQDLSACLVAEQNIIAEASFPNSGFRVVSHNCYPMKSPKGVATPK